MMTRNSGKAWRSGVVMAACALLVVSGNLFAQSFQGGVRGAVRDADGAIIPGVEVQLINEGTNVARATITNEAGEFVFAAVPPATYKLRAALQGFKTFERSGLNVGTQQFMTIDVKLEVGSISEEIQVVADAPLIETSTASTATALPSALLETLPNTGRNAFMMALTVPTVVHVGNPFYVRQQDQTNATLVSLGGGPVRGNNYLIDGVPVTDWRNRTVVFPNIESVGEIKVQVNTYDAEMGRTGGGVFNTTLKSGQNDWHGSAHVQQRPDEFGANNYFDNRAGRKALPYYYWLYGGSGGGPIRKDKTFFWASTEGYRTGTNWTGVLTVPTAQQKLGNFSQTVNSAGQQVVIYDPTTTRLTNPALPPGAANPYIRDAFPGNVIPAARINPVGRALMAFLPDPQSAGRAGGLDNYTQSDTLIDKADQVTVKLDNTFSERQSLTGSYVWYNSAEPFAVYFRGTPGEIADGSNSKLFRTVHAPAINYTMTPNATTVVTLRYGYNWFKDTCVPASQGFDLSKLSFNNAFINGVQSKAFPSVSVEGHQGVGGQGDIEIEWWSQNFLGNFSKFIGRHNVRMGGAYRRLGVDFFDHGNASGNFSFTRQFTQRNPNAGDTTSGNAIASLLLGYPASGSVQVGTPLSYFTDYYSGYLQDDFRMNQDFTLNFGVRWEYDSDMAERNNKTTVGFDRATTNPVASKITDAALRDRIKGGLIYAGQGGAKTHQANAQKTKFGPRIGFAWTATTATVFRGGYGVFYAPIQGYYPGSNNMGALGFAASTSYIASADGDLTPAGSVTNPFPGGFNQPSGNRLGLQQNLGDNLFFIDQNNEHGYVHQYSMDIQRELPGNMALTVGFVGSRSEQLTVGGTVATTVNYNQLRVADLALGSQLQQTVANPFFGIAEMGGLGRQRNISRGQLLRPYPHFLNINAYRVSQGFGRYNSAILKIERRLDDKGIGFRINYTRSKSLDNYFGEANNYSNRAGVALDNNDLKREYSLSIVDIPHRLVVTPMWDLPFGQGKRWATTGAAERIFGGWNIAPVISYQSGFPSSIQQNQNNSGTLGGTQRPNLASGAQPCTEGSMAQRLENWFNPAAFTQAAAFTLGNVARTISCRGPSNSNMDVAIRKNIRITEETRISFRVEALNATNTPKFRAPNQALGNVNFGRITSQTGFPRIIQWMLRYEF